VKSERYCASLGGPVVDAYGKPIDRDKYIPPFEVLPLTNTAAPAPIFTLPPTQDAVATPVVGNDRYCNTMSIASRNSF
jgi:hypothetical protein